MTSVLGRAPRTVVHWAAIEDGGYVARFDGEDWRLMPAKGRYPWSLEGSKSHTRQDIGGVTPGEAQHRAAMWLDITSRFPYPRGNR